MKNFKVDDDVSTDITNQVLLLVFTLLLLCSPTF